MASVGLTSSLQNALINIALTSKKVSGLSKKLATGQAVTDGKDNAIAIQKINRLTSDINGINAASENIGTASSLLGTAQGGLTAILDSLQQLRETAVQAADGTISATDRTNLTNRSNDILSSINQTAQNLNFGGVNLLDGSYGTRDIQVGPDAGDTVSVSLGSATTAGLGVSDIDLSTDSSAGDAISAIDDAITQAISAMSDAGSQQNRLDSIQSSNDSTLTNLSQSRSGLQDLSYTEAVTQMVGLKIQQQLQLQILSANLDTQKQTSLSIRI